MNRKLNRISSMLFMLFVLATIVVYFVTDKNMKWTWITGMIALFLYFVSRFTKYR